MTHQKPKPHYLIVGILALIVIALLVQNQLLLKKVKEDVSLREISTAAVKEKAEKLYNSELNSIIPSDVEPSVKALSKTEISAKAEKLPVVYSGLNEGVYEIIYEGSERGVLVIYDLENNKIVKYFMLNSVVLGE